MLSNDQFPKVEIQSVDELHDWLKQYHATSQTVWLVTYKKSAPEKYVTVSEILDELISFGWIDGIRRKLDEDRTMQLISPRKVQHWSKSYKDRVAKLKAEGRMQLSGLKSVEDGIKCGLWDFMDDVDALIVPDDLEKSFSISKKAYSYFQETPDAYKRNLLRWIKLAKTEKTRNDRIWKIVNYCEKGERIPQM